MVDLAHSCCRCLVNDPLLRLKPILAWSSFVNRLRVESTKSGAHRQVIIMIANAYLIDPIVVLAVRDRLLVLGDAQTAIAIVVSVLRVGQVVGWLVVQLGSWQGHLDQLERLVLDFARRDVRHWLTSRSRVKTRARDFTDTHSIDRISLMLLLLHWRWSIALLIFLCGPRDFVDFLLWHGLLLVVLGGVVENWADFLVTLFGRVKHHLLLVLSLLLACAILHCWGTLHLSWGLVVCLLQRTCPAGQSGRRWWLWIGIGVRIFRRHRPVALLAFLRFLNNHTACPRLLCKVEVLIWTSRAGLVNHQIVNFWTWLGLDKTFYFGRSVDHFRRLLLE